jgi:type II secretory pathway pseudopilin PulG
MCFLRPYLIGLPNAPSSVRASRTLCRGKYAVGNLMTTATKKNAAKRGFSMIETVMVLLIMMITAAFALPITQTTLNNYRLRSAVASATWAIQSTRFQSLMQGYTYQVTFAGGTGGVNPTYQIANEPVGATTFTNVGAAVPMSGSPVAINQTEVLQFKSNGTVATSPATAAPYSFTITYAGSTKTITVSNYGNVSVAP